MSNSHKVENVETVSNVQQEDCVNSLIQVIFTQSRHYGNCSKCAITGLCQQSDPIQIHTKQTLLKLYQMSLIGLCQQSNPSQIHTKQTLLKI